MVARGMRTGLRTFSILPLPLGRVRPPGLAATAAVGAPAAMVPHLDKAR